MTSKQQRRSSSSPSMSSTTAAGSSSPSPVPPQWARWVYAAVVLSVLRWLCEVTAVVRCCVLRRLHLTLQQPSLAPSQLPPWDVIEHETARVLGAPPRAGPTHVAAVLRRPSSAPDLVVADVVAFLTLCCALPPSAAAATTRHVTVHDRQRTVASLADAIVAAIIDPERSGDLSSRINVVVHLGFGADARIVHPKDKVRDHDNAKTKTRVGDAAGWEIIDSDLATDESSLSSSSCSSDPRGTCHLWLVGGEEGKERIVSVAKQIAMDETRHGRPVTVADMEALLNPDGVPDPQLLFVFNDFASPLILDDFSPWQLRLTEIFNANGDGRVTFGDFLEGLYRYSFCEQRLGK